MKITSLLKRFVFHGPWFVILLSMGAGAYLGAYVDLQPHVDSDFFFSSNDPRIQEEKRLSEAFPQESQIIISAEGDLESDEYLRRLDLFTKELMLIDEVSGVKSLSNGPGDIRRALESPLWRRLLISQDGRSSNAIVFLSNAPAMVLIPKIEEVIREYHSEDFKLKIAGVPYAVELIRRYLLRDLEVFSVIAFVMFSLAVIMIFRSLRVLLGTLVTCIDACVFTLIFSQRMGIKIGILTANISTIVFVLTLSHIVFLTNNWRRLRGEKREDNRAATLDAVRETFGASFWCMLTTLLGFASLMSVQARPLRELGYSGVIGTLVSIVVAYGIYPMFLMVGRTPRRQQCEQVRGKVFVGHYMWATVMMALLAGFALSGIGRMNTDPSLLEYFKRGDVLRDGMEYIDHNGGSSPLDLVVRDREGRPLNTEETYRRLWELQEALEDDPNVGSVISLPVLLAEGKRVPFSFMVSLEGMLRIMGHKRFNRIADTFITDDRMQARFFLRMTEDGRRVPRVEVAEQLRSIVREHGFEPSMIGGIYVLQGEMSRKVISSLIYGLGWLILLFTGIAFIVSRSIKTSLAMVGCLAVIPVCMLGLIGHFQIPLDIISAPAANVAIGMGIDSMIHMVMVMRRFRARGDSFWQAWKDARRILWQPVFSSMLIICAGFGIFSFSMFPPSQRFGMAVVLGTVIAAPTALFVLPSVVGPWFYKD